MFEDIIGCKWSLCVLEMAGRGIVRPGAMQRTYQGLSAKVLNERLRKLVRYGLLERRAFAEIPPHVEYRLTPFGRRFSRIVDALRELESEPG